MSDSYHGIVDSEQMSNESKFQVKTGVQLSETPKVACLEAIEMIRH